jgi:hypothetical protein
MGVSMRRVPYHTREETWDLLGFMCRKNEQMDYGLWIRLSVESVGPLQATVTLMASMLTKELVLGKVGWGLRKQRIPLWS